MGAHEFKIFSAISFKELILCIYLPDFPNNISWLTGKLPCCSINTLIFTFTYGK